ncbi:MAG: signal transduction histidine kinase [Rickettsiales bacterium]|jgi:signal transduction histidine kinase
MKNQYLSNISHDLRNYISGISGLANIILEDISSYQKKQIAQGIKPDRDLEEASEFAKMLAPYSHEAMQYVDDMLDISQIETGKFTLGSIEECDLKSVIDRLLIFNKSFIKNHQITAQTKIDPDIPKIKCDVRRLKQILTNLITNAVKYSPINNVVEISVAAKNNQIQIAISDCGIGMTKKEIAMALSGEGVKIDKSVLNKNVPLDSHGLGMPIVKQLVELMNGKMKIESTKGKGTNIIVGLPALKKGVMKKRGQVSSINH